jgi:hypothetical protein
MQIRLYLDEAALSRALAHNLRLRGIDVTTVAEEGRAGLADAEQLEFAASQGRAIYTSNISDFYHLHTEYLSQGRQHAGIIFLPQQRYSIGEQLRRLLKLIRSKTAEAMANNIEFLSSW